MGEKPFLIFRKLSLSSIMIVIVMVTMIMFSEESFLAFVKTLAASHFLAN